MISHHHKCVFVHIPKCGGQSVETAFLHDIGLDWRRRAPLLLRFNDNPDLGPPRLAHLLARDYVAMGYLPRDMFDSYFKFAVVRNPYRRIVSTYQYLDPKKPFLEFLTENLRDDPGAELHYFIRPQMDYLSDKDGKLIVDEIYKLEDIQTGFTDVQQKTGLKTQLPHVNSSKAKHEKQHSGKRRALVTRALLDLDFARVRREIFGRTEIHKNWKDYFQQETCRAVVAEYYKADFDSLGYKPDL